MAFGLVVPVASSLVCEVHVDDNSHGMYCYNYRASYALGNGMKRPESNRAFTLIELLVVISIISLLISMLMPAIKRARGLARMVECSSSLHQLLVGTKAFSEETHDAIPEAYYTDGKRSWLTQVVGDILGVEENVPTSFWCPEESTEQSFTPSGGSYYWGEKSTRTYGMSDWGAANSDAPHRVRYDNIQHQQTVYFYTDTNKAGVYGGTAASAWRYPTFFGGRPHEPANYVDYRHFGNVNMAYVDGHVAVPETIPYSTWHVWNPYGHILPLVTHKTRQTVWYRLGFSTSPYWMHLDWMDR